MAIDGDEPVGRVGHRRLTAPRICPRGWASPRRRGSITGTPDAVSSSTASCDGDGVGRGGQHRHGGASRSRRWPRVTRALSGFAYSASTVDVRGCGANGDGADRCADRRWATPATPSSVCTVDANTGVTDAWWGWVTCVVTATAASGRPLGTRPRVTFDGDGAPAAGTLVLNVSSTIAGDNTVNIAEKAAGFAICRRHRGRGGCVGVSVDGRHRDPDVATSADVWSGTADVVRERAGGCVLHHGHER